MANWYSYDGVGLPDENTSYNKMSVKPNCASSGTFICAIYLNESTDEPANPLEGAILQYIDNALGSQTAQPTTGKRFVYVKGA